MARKMFTDSDIWKKQRWFRKLPPMHKIAYFYIKDQCNHAGIWAIDCADLIEDTGLKDFNISEFVKSCNTEYDKITGQQKVKERVRVIDENHLWITGFIQFQNCGKDGLVTTTRGPVESAIEILRGHNLLDEALSKGFLKLKTNIKVQAGSTPLQPPFNPPSTPVEPGFNKVEVKVEEEVIDNKDKGVNKKIDDLIDALCDYFSVKKVTKSIIYDSVCDFATTLSHRNEIEIVSMSLVNYMSYKTRSQETIHNIKTWIGTKENHYQDGEWAITDWQAKNKNYNDGNRSTTQTTTSASGSVIKGGKAFGDVRRHQAG